MSYFANLVNRTLGITPVAQPVIQARFAPPSPTTGALGEGTSASHADQLTSRSPQTRSTSQTIQASSRPPTIDSELKSEPAREDASGPVTHESGPSEQAQTKLTATEWAAVPRRFQHQETTGLTTPDGQAIPFDAKIPELPSSIPSAAHFSEEFRLMNTSPPPLAPSNLRPAAAPFRSPHSQPKQAEPMERPVVRVHIGRVDVRMVAPAAKEQRAASPTIPGAKPASLDDYLRARQGGKS